jgi:hypothetical protein
MGQAAGQPAERPLGPLPPDRRQVTRQLDGDRYGAAAARHVLPRQPAGGETSWASARPARSAKSSENPFGGVCNQSWGWAGGLLALLCAFSGARRRAGVCVDENDGEILQESPLVGPARSGRP